MRIILAALCLAACGAANAEDVNWNNTLAARIPLYGHRNWIVIADSAYPAQAREGIETITVPGNQESVLRNVLAALDASKHVRPIVYTDAELKFVPEADIPAIGPYRATLADLFRNRETHSLPHLDIIHKLDEAAQTFRVLIIKTNMKMPYTSVFLELDCAYWSPEAEQKLRAAMAGRQ